MNVTPGAKQFSGDENRALSLAASRVLRHVDNALADLADKKNDAASANIEKSLTLVKIINGVLPTTTVKTEITGAGISYTDDDRITAAYVPIYREYDSVDILSPVAAQQQATKVEKTAVKPAVVPGAKLTTKPALAEEVTYAGADYSSMKLDLRLARRDLLAAQDLLKAGDTAGAVLGLQDILASGVVFEFSSTRLPVTRAMDNLRLAESELKNSQPEQAKIALQGARDALKNYEAVAGDSRAKEVRQLEAQINAVAENIAKHDQASFSKKVSAWWSKCLEWVG